MSLSVVLFVWVRGACWEIQEVMGASTVWEARCRCLHFCCGLGIQIDYSSNFVFISTC